MSGEQQEFDDLAEFKAYLDERNPRRDRKPRTRPDVQEIGPGPAPKAGPFCRLCKDHRRLVEIEKASDGTFGYLCQTCVKQVIWDRAKRCVRCGTPSAKRLIESGGYCQKCVKSTDAQENLYRIHKYRWVGIIRGR